MSNQPKIDKGIPLPDDKQVQRRWQPLLAKMDVGDSFFIPDKIPDQVAAKKPAKQLGIKLAMRQWEEPDGTRGTRVWRIE
jgi:hypothetical protein